MKLCEGKIVELDPNKWYWLVINAYDNVLAEQIEHLRMENGRILMVEDIGNIEFIENPDSIKGIIVKKF
ncbi:MAG: hypothetical protein ACYSR8_12255 [Planctomycetota bacterium]|jgi:hypothetical protein